MNDRDNILMPQQTRHIPWGWIIWTSAFVAVGVVASAVIVQLLYTSRISPEDRVLPAPVAIVLGAAVTKDGEPSDALRDRIMTGVDLYKTGKADELLLTGDDGRFHRDEVSVMKKTAIAAGVPEKDIRVDGEGYRTFESCRRAIEVFHVSQAIVVTQRFHLGRALFLCNELGIDATGVPADRETYVNARWFWIRDLLASAKAFWDVYAIRPASPVR